MVSGLLARANLFQVSGHVDATHPGLSAAYVLRALQVENHDFELVREEAAEMLSTYLAATGTRPANDFPDSAGG